MSELSISGLKSFFDCFRCKYNIEPFNPVLDYFIFDLSFRVSPATMKLP
jgi:hypothetical protein